MANPRRVKRGGSPSASLSEVEARLRVRSLMPQTLDYDPFESPANTKRLLLDLVTWTLYFVMAMQALEKAFPGSKVQRVE